ncbi:MAG: 3-oxoacyl-[acyl-carrier-protein] reductase [Gemmatimonadetes bacterium]|jgi:3-oxoacyl-[acyl-carrier protein] reductase|nr:3-oxoacyl-[acyl-carrier-protein] reductase [Gemmatimonadota bacterium]MEE2846236.1 3-oxoacyl-[acyl-carrier-protein] reductase [Gemmatimonadota bacterium]HAC05262.1 3-oxoacyl-[acyl-carrier-protein] reductase [Gemmatimonadota bacterium]|tara:strand:- start:9543 stop:10286 length:744 start_codon:yes stop_codon:yes gene_type:complete
MSARELADKVAIVTGGSRGIGLAIAESLADAGATIAVIGRNGERAKQAAAALSGAGHQGYACDVADPFQVTDTVKAIQEGLGSVDILINNAGLTRDNLLMRMKDEEFDEVIATNLKGAFNFTRAVTRSMMKKRDGVILNITSVVGLIGNAGQTNYAASKAGMIGMTKSVAKELGSRGVRCNALAPGFIRTDMTAELSEDQIESLQSLIPLGRLGETDDISGVVRFLVSPAARYITGQVLAVDGGMVM